MIRLPTVADIDARNRKDRQVLGMTAYALDAIVLLTFLAIVAVAFPRFVKARDGWRKDEVKANLKVIQVALERYATDHSGTYPLILYGGHPTDTFATTSSHEVSEFPGDVDWLLQDGYLAAYPYNPYRRKSREPVRLQAKDFFPEKFCSTVSPDAVEIPRVNIWGRGGLRGHEDRSRQWVERSIGGPYGDLMWDISEGERHPPFLVYLATQDIHGADPEYALKPASANPDVRLLQLEPDVSQLVWPAVGGFWYVPQFVGIGNFGSFKFDGYELHVDQPIMGEVRGYQLFGYGEITSLGEDKYSWYGDTINRPFNGPWDTFYDPGLDACFPFPDGRPDGVIAAVLDRESAKPRATINQDDQSSMRGSD